MTSPEGSVTQTAGSPSEAASPGSRRAADLSKVVAIIPVGMLETAKSRLGEPLDAEERVALVTSMLAHTIDAAARARRIAAVLVVSPDAALLASAGRAGVRALAQRTVGLNQALVEGREHAVAMGATAIVVLPTDLPAIDSAELDRIVEAASMAIEAGRPLVALVPDRHGEGTNALLLAPPDTIEFHFGEGSRAIHAGAAAAAGTVYRELRSPLEVDVDTPEDLLLADAAGFARSDDR